MVKDDFDWHPLPWYYKDGMIFDASGDSIVSKTGHIEQAVADRILKGVNPDDKQDGAE